MSIRIHEVHPMLAHFPLALFPTSFFADFIGRITGRNDLMRLGKQLAPVAAVSGMATAVAGLAAQEAVEAGDAHDILVTHRNLNAGLVGLIGLLAILRMRSSKPRTGYLLAGGAALLVMDYTAYLGGKMVYDHGVGVDPANGVRKEASPEIRYGHLQEVAQTAAHNVGHAAEHAAKHIHEGSIAPVLRR